MHRYNYNYDICNMIYIYIYIYTHNTHTYTYIYIYIYIYIYNEIRELFIYRINIIILFIYNTEMTTASREIDYDWSSGTYSTWTAGQTADVYIRIYGDQSLAQTVGIYTYLFT